MNTDKEEKILAAKAVFEKWNRERYPIKMYSQEWGWGEGEIYDVEKFVPVYAPFLTPGRYYVSDTGYVMSCIEPTRDKKDGTCPHIFRPQKDPNDKYYLITFWENGKKYSYPVHRIVWFSFANYAIENNAPEYMPQCFEPIDIANTQEAKKTLEKYFSNTPHNVKRRVKEENPSASAEEIRQILRELKPDIYEVHHIKGYDKLANAKPGIVNNVDNLELVRADLHDVLDILAREKSPDDILAEIARKSPDDQTSMYVRGTNYHQNEREAYVASDAAMEKMFDNTIAWKCLQALQDIDMGYLCETRYMLINNGGEMTYYQIPDFGQLVPISGAEGKMKHKLDEDIVVALTDGIAKIKWGDKHEELITVGIPIAPR